MHRQLRTPTLAILTTLAVVIAVSCTRNDAPDRAIGRETSGPATGSSSATSWFFSQNARGGTWTVQGDTGSLQLTDVSDVTGAITDRPSRVATHLDTSNFVDGWTQRFRADPPNAVVSVIGTDGAPHEAAVTLSDPVVDPSARTLTYTVRVLSGSLPAEFVDASLMIDDAGIGAVTLTIDDDAVAAGTVTEDDELNTDQPLTLVLFMQNAAGTDDGVVAWQVVNNLGTTVHPSLTLASTYELSASDSFGNATPQVPVVDGQRYQVSLGASGDVMAYAGPSSTPRAFQLTNALQAGTVDAQVLADGRLVGAAEVPIGQTATFQYQPAVWVAVVPSAVEGEVLSPADVADATRLELEGVASADLVITSDGSDYEFNLANVQYI